MGGTPQTDLRSEVDSIAERLGQQLVRALDGELAGTGGGVTGQGERRLGEAAFGSLFAALRRREPFFHSARRYPAAFLRRLHRRLIEDFRREADPCFAPRLAALSSSFREVLVADSGRLQDLARRLRLRPLLLRAEEGPQEEGPPAVPGRLTVLCDLFRGYAIRLWFDPDAERPPAMSVRGATLIELIASLRSGTLLLGDGRLATPEVFHRLERVGASGAFRIGQRSDFQRVARKGGTGSWTTGETGGEGIDDGEVELPGMAFSRPLRRVAAAKNGKVRAVLTDVLDREALPARLALELAAPVYSLDQLFLDAGTVVDLRRFNPADPQALEAQVYAAGILSAALRVGLGWIAGARGLPPEVLSPDFFLPQLVRAAGASWRKRQAPSPDRRESGAAPRPVPPRTESPSPGAPRSSAPIADDEECPGPASAGPGGPAGTLEAESPAAEVMEGGTPETGPGAAMTGDEARAWRRVVSRIDALIHGQAMTGDEARAWRRGGSAIDPLDSRAGAGPAPPVKFPGHGETSHNGTASRNGAETAPPRAHPAAGPFQVPFPSIPRPATPEEVERIVRLKLDARFEPFCRTYAQVGHRDGFLWRWVQRCVEVTTLSCVDDHLRADSRTAKLLGVMLVTLLDDVADNWKDGEFLDLLLEIPAARRQPATPCLNPERAGYYRLTAEVWGEVTRLVSGLPRYGEFRELLKFDYAQLLNTMRYALLVGRLPDVQNPTEHDVYQPHNMHMVITGTVDVMASPRFDRLELPLLRQALWRGQRMGRIANMVSTWEREIRERDFTSGVFAEAINRGIVRAPDLSRMSPAELTAAIAGSGLIPYFLSEWERLRDEVHRLAGRVRSADLFAYAAGLEELLQNYLGTRV